MRITAVCTLVCACLLLGNGCEKSGNTSSSNSTRKKPDLNSPIATIHWLGMDRIAKQTNATGFLRIWRLAESEKLKSQTLDKLALAPWRLTGTNPPAAVTNYAPLLRANHSASLLRPLLDDLVKDEWYLEIREAKPASAQMALAVRLNPKSAAEWDTNLQDVFGTIPGARRTAATGSGWQIQLTNASATIPPYLRHVELMHAGAWTILGLAPDQNVVLADVVSRVKRAQAPFTSAATNDWVESQVDLRRLSAAFSWGWDLPAGWPEISLNSAGTGERLSTRARLTFPDALQIKLDPWLVPTNLIHEPVQGFTAVRGIKPWLNSLDWWKTLHAPETPNQVIAWSQSGSPFLVYAAAPDAQADKVMTSLGPQIMQSFNPLLASNRMGSWERATSSDGVAWKGPIISPFVQSTRIANNQFLFTGLSPYILSNGPSPSVTLKELLVETNTVYFDREITGPRLEAWMFISQLSRLILRRAQLPSDGAAITWFRAMGSLLAPSATTAKQTGRETISVARVSTLGLTAAELHVLADWLESSEFPAHLHSSVAKLPAVPPRHMLPKNQTGASR